MSFTNSEGYSLRSAKMGLTSADCEKIKSIVKGILHEGDFLQTFSDKVGQVIGDKFHELLKEQREQIDKVCNEVVVLKEKNKSLELQLDQCEQASRSMNVRIFGLRQLNDEDIRNTVLDVFNTKMKLSIKVADIKKCYRVPTKTQNNNKPPPILVRFSNDAARISVLKNRKNLGKSGVFIKEDLTKYRLSLFQEAVQKFTSKCVWCLNGNVYVKRDSNVIRINSGADLCEIN